jgi:hypothetical protein
MHLMAKLTQSGRKLLSERVREQGWTVATGAEAQGCSRALTLCRASRQPDDVVGVRMTMVPRHDECVDLTELSWPPC